MKFSTPSERSATIAMQAVEGRAASQLSGIKYADKENTMQGESIKHKSSMQNVASTYTISNAAAKRTVTHTHRTSKSPKATYRKRQYPGKSSLAGRKCQNGRPNREAKHG